jgi:hypothetical protein
MDPTFDVLSWEICPKTNHPYIRKSLEEFIRRNILSTPPFKTGCFEIYSLFPNIIHKTKATGQTIQGKNNQGKIVMAPFV